jgi:NAD(P)-dependent dehydrogenase (short-subunit alcohol dehydrogenase family)
MSMKADGMFNVAGDVVVITGAASGLGLAIAEVLAANGAKLALLDIDGPSLDDISERLRQLGTEVLAQPVDVRDRSALRRAFDIAADHYGGIDTVFANAGIGAGRGFVSLDGTRTADGAIDTIADELWDDVIAVNLSGVFAAIKSAAIHMKPRGRGRIIVTTSIASFRNQGWVGTPYMPAKAGAAHLVRQAALELASFNITVNAIAPGAFATNIGGGRLKTEATAVAMRKLIPQGRIAAPKDLQGLALFLASPAADFITGIEIPIDGGSSLGRP